MRIPRLPLVLGLIAGATLGSAGVAQATFKSAPTASESFSTRSLIAPTGLTAAPSGHNVVLGWTAGSGGSGYAVSGVANGTSSSCTSATFSALSTTATTAYTDSGRSTPQGTYYCYKVATTYGTWSSQASNPTAAAQLGVVASSVAITNGGTSGRIDSGDRIVVTFNQPITTTTGPPAGDNICTSTTGSIALGSTGTGTTCTLTGLDLGTLSGLTVGVNSRFAATWAWSAGNTVLTITVGARSAGSNTSVTGTATLNPTTTAGKLLSATGSFQTCSTNTGGGNCLPTATGSF
jgi:hypothetical protein